MNKSDLINAIAEKADCSKKSAGDALNAIIEVISEELANEEKVQLIGFGTFETRRRAARKGKNPQTGEEMKIPASKSPVFKAGKALKDKVNN
jgi:DNA-binding protein HU-beta